MQPLWYNYSNLIGSANILAASTKTSLVTFPHEHLTWDKSTPSLIPRPHGRRESGLGTRLRTPLVGGGDVITIPTNGAQDLHENLLCIGDAAFLGYQIKMNW